MAGRRPVCSLAHLTLSLPWLMFLLSQFLLSGLVFCLKLAQPVRGHHSSCWTILSQALPALVVTTLGKFRRDCFKLLLSVKISNANISSSRRARANLTADLECSHSGLFLTQSTICHMCQLVNILIAFMYSRPVCLQLTN